MLSESSLWGGYLVSIVKSKHPYLPVTYCPQQVEIWGICKGYVERWIQDCAPGMGACSIRICQFLSFLPLISSPGIGGRASTDRCINTSNNNHSVDYVLMSAYSFLIKLKPSVKSKLFSSLTSPSELTSYLAM